ncbi:hypothetical protein HRR14_05520 [Gardnerella vaginalis]|uniref:hypothetical protein n=1 Tax=Gardnerella vaginalis TaxID=2702 RepID=UPI001574514D|nr:hypothetical protein [Gardnerella vaginalis]NSX29141.1 hypothetical protein [Gardnerella vaginalis]
MMNKKAIAAFAAGATLLAGFAMATPAMAESLIPMYNQNNGFAEVSDGTDASVLKATIEQDKQEIKAAEDWNDKVSSAYANANTNTATVTVDGVVPADSSQATHVLVLGKDGKLNQLVKADAVTQAQVDALVAAAKGELAAKGAKGHGKSGEKLGNAGVGVALTALAASMLAGMGAAVRKMRH